MRGLARAGQNSGAGKLEMRMSHWIAEAFAAVLFASGLWVLRSKGRARMIEYLMIVVYGFMLEILDMHFFKSYHYSSHFIFMIGGVPVCIALLWAVILAGAMEISDASGIPLTVRPFFDGILALWLDLGLDAIAIRMGYWSWKIPLNEGWFGVPAGNLYAWMWVAFFYSIFARAVRLCLEKDKNAVSIYLLVPHAAYIFLWCQLYIAGFAGSVFHLVTPNQKLWLFAAQFAVFSFLSFYHLAQPRQVKKVDPFWLWSRYTLHGYFLICFFIFGFYRTAPWLGAIAVAVFAAEILGKRFVLYPSPSGRG